MSLQRRISWSAVVRDMQNDRVSVEARRAFLAAQHNAKIEKLRAQAGAALVVASRFDRAVIMAMAVRNARADRLNHPGRSWASCMAEGLRYAWACAKAARRAAAH